MDDKDFNAMVARNIRFLREERGWSTEELARRTGKILGKSLIIKIEHNAVETVHKKKIDLVYIENIARVLGVPTDVITESNEEISLYLKELENLPKTLQIGNYGQLDRLKYANDLASSALLKCAFRGPLDQAKALLFSGELDYNKGDLELSIKQLMHALDIGTKIENEEIASYARHQLANCYYALGKFDEVHKLVDEEPALTESSFTPRKAKSLLLKGLTYARQKLWREAESFFRKAIDECRLDSELQVLEGRCFQALGGLYRDTKRYSESVQASERAIKIAESVSDGICAIYALKTLGEIYGEIGENEKSYLYYVEAYNKAIAVKEFRRIDSLRIKFCIAKCSRDLVQIEETIHAFETLDVAKEEVSSMHITAARVCRELSKDKDAHEYYEKAIQILQG